MLVHPVGNIEYTDSSFHFLLGLACQTGSIDRRDFEGVPREDSTYRERERKGRAKVKVNLMRIKRVGKRRRPTRV